MQRSSKVVFEKRPKFKSSTSVGTLHANKFIMITCGVCGQQHPSNSAHLYNYESQVDDDLTCHLCFQPFVNPLDTKCGCTYCTVCLESYLTRYKYCPIDNQKIDIKSTHRASPALRKILDKLMVLCPNVDYCDEIMPRNQLELHLLTKCKGTLAYCTRAYLGCDYQGPRSTLSSHSQECLYKEKSERLLNDPIEAGRLCQIEINRGYDEMGLYLVGGSDTPLISTVIQGIKQDSVACRDDRLQEGDHILRLNGYDLASYTHKQVLDLFSQCVPICTMTVYRDTLDELPDFNFEYREEIVRVILIKDKSHQLGIKLGQNKKTKGVWIIDIMKNSVVDLDGRLRVNDRILEVNGQCVKFQSKEEVLQILTSSINQVAMVVSREIPPVGSNETCAGRTNRVHKREQPNSVSLWQEFTLAISKERNERIGLNIAGGLRSIQNESTPIFVTSIEPKSCIDKSKLIKKGDLIIKVDDEPLFGYQFKEAFDMLESTRDNEIVALNYVRCPDIYNDSDEEMFRSNWRYFISIPIAYQTAKNIQVFKDSDEYLGITISGGKDSKYDKIFIKTVIQGSSAHKSKKLKCGDMILSVDGVSLQGMNHSDVVQVMQSLCGNIRFVVISCPGTLV